MRGILDSPLKKSLPVPRCTRGLNAARSPNFVQQSLGTQRCIQDQNKGNGLTLFASRWCHGDLLSHTPCCSTSKLLPDKARRLLSLRLWPRTAVGVPVGSFQTLGDWLSGLADLGRLGPCPCGALSWALCGSEALTEEGDWLSLVFIAKQPKVTK
ncbi:hypothetical protein NDU88_004053 [Pleurodeles waltl]|uniref:Uncharacterized protein n=1 Tax=Pleurodeles waltl TaxID=8319 RepID=A0AAV7L3I7_PLEWA|nr:hypothetical protein NDU88_004053 [Pleurodeles waltl]